MNIVVLCGGLSYERKVSLASGFVVAKALRESGHKAATLDVFLGVPNLINIDDFFNNCNNKEVIVSALPPDLEKVKNLRNVEIKGLFGENVLNICKRADIVFMMLHGADGENGKIQATFDLLDIKYTGSGHLGSALALNKSLSKQIMKQNQIITPLSQKITSLKDKLNFNFPVVVKPEEGGSSVGVSIVYSKTEYTKAIMEGLLFGDYLLVEEYIKGREFSVGILNNKALPVIEIIPENGFYNYQNKYQVGMTKELCPANITNEQMQKIQSIALEVHKILGLNNYSRIDFILGEDEFFYCLEANTAPGMTRTSLLPQEAKASGISFQELCKVIINK